MPIGPEYFFFIKAQNWKDALLCQASILVKAVGVLRKDKIHWESTCHGVWKSQKKSHSTLRAKRATFTFWVEKKLIKKFQKWSNLACFWKHKACGQTELPDRSVLKGQKSGKNVKITKNSNATFWVIFKQCACM